VTFAVADQSSPAKSADAVACPKISRVMDAAGKAREHLGRSPDQRQRSFRPSLMLLADRTIGLRVNGTVAGVRALPVYAASREDLAEGLTVASAALDYVNRLAKRLERVDEAVVDPDLREILPLGLLSDPPDPFAQRGKNRRPSSTLQPARRRRCSSHGSTSETPTRDM
jgi:hypothetical protein